MLTRWVWRLVRWGIYGLVALFIYNTALGVVESSDDLHDRLLVPAPVDPGLDLTVLGMDGGTITLPRTPLTQTNGLWGLRWPDGYGQVGEVVAVRTDEVQREYIPLTGTPEVGAVVGLDEFAYPAEPGAIRGVPVRAVFIDGPQGDYPAYLTENDGDLWVLAIHDRAQDGRRQVARIMPTLAEMNVQVLVVTYRNDPGAPPDPEERLHWGVEEWQEIEAAVAYAFANGAKDVVLYGWGMGGSIAATFEHESQLRARVAGIILDSAVLDLGAYADAGQVKSGIKHWVDEAGKALAAMRWDIKWASLDQVKRAEEYVLPVLLMHGTVDDLSPVAVADELAAARPDVVTYVRFEGGGHGDLWNVDRSRYERAVRSFLETVTAPPEQQS